MSETGQNKRQNNKKTENSKSIFSRIRSYISKERIRSFLIIACLAAIFITTWMAWPSFYQIDREGIDGTVDYLPYRLKEEDKIVQQFIPLQEGLQSFTLSFDLSQDWRNPDDAQINIDIYCLDSEKNIVSNNVDKSSAAILDIENLSAAEPLYSLSLSGSDINRYTQTELDIDLGKDCHNKEHVMILTAVKIPENQNMYIHTTNAQLRPMQINDRQTGLALTMTLIYNQFDWDIFVIALALMLVVLVLLFIPVSFINNIFNKYNIIPILLAPAVLQIMIEFFNSLNHDFWLQPQVFWLAYLVLLLIELVFIGITGSCRLGIYFNLAVFAGLAIGNHVKLFFRGDPFVAGDLRILTEAAQTVNNLKFEASSRFLLGWLMLLIYVILFSVIEKKKRKPVWRISLTVLPLVVLFLLINTLIMNSDRMDKFLKISRYPWNNMMNYKLNGFTIPFMQSIHHLIIETPENDAPVSQYAYELPESVLSNEADPERPHVIAIMSESYADFNNIREIETSEPVTPFFDSLAARSNTITGNLLVSVFGGGTCNTEFEFLTGSSMLFMNDGIIPYTSYFDRPTHSLPEIFKKQGYQTLAIHPYYRTFWDRHKVYPNIGFDKFIALEDFPEGGYVRQFKGDQAAFDQIILALENSKPDERQFIFTVTMQNHFPYYGEEEILADLNYNIKIPGMIDVEAVELFLSIMRESDDALSNLMAYLENIDEPVLLVFFGDHLPGNNNVFNTFFESLFEKPITDLSPAETQKMYETPYLIWANYDLPDLDKELTSPNFFGTTVIDLAGIESTPYFDLVAALQTDIKAMSNKFIIMQNGRRVNREQIPTNLTRQLDRYWRYEYDNIIANKEVELDE